MDKLNGQWKNLDSVQKLKSFTWISQQTFQLNAAETDVEVADVAFEAELAAAGARDRVSNECLFEDYFLNCLVVMTSLPDGIWWFWNRQKWDKVSKQYFLTLFRLLLKNMRLAHVEKLRLQDCCFSRSLPSFLSVSLWRHTRNHDD